MNLTQLTLKTGQLSTLPLNLLALELLEELGYLRRLGAGHVGLLPLGQRVLDRLRDLGAQALETQGAQKITLPLSSPTSLWLGLEDSWFLSPNLQKFKTPDTGEYYLTPPPENPMMDLLRPLLTTSADLPLMIYRESPSFDGPSGPGCREFLRLEALSFHSSFMDLNHHFPRLVAAFKAFFRDCGLPVMTAEAGCGPWGGQKAFAFLLPTFQGQTTMIACSECGYTARQDAARGEKDHPTGLPGSLERRTFTGTTWKEAAAALGITPDRLVNIKQFDSPRGLVTALWRADYQLSPEKLARAAGVPYLQEAFNPQVPGFEDLRAAGLLVADDAVTEGVNLAFPSREKGVFYTQVNFGRDFESPIQGDIVVIGRKDACPFCKAALAEIKTRELGLLVKGSQLLAQRGGLKVLDPRRGALDPFAGTSRLFLGQILESCAEVNRDDRGLRWPPKVAPFMASVVLAEDGPRWRRDLAPWLEKWRDLVLFDDRPVSLEEKIQTADRLGLPVRITFLKDLWPQKLVEMRCRQTGQIKHQNINLIKGDLEQLFQKGTCLND